MEFEEKGQWTPVIWICIKMFMRIYISSMKLMYVHVVCNIVGESREN